MWLPHAYFLSHQPWLHQLAESMCVMGSLMALGDCTSQAIEGCADRRRARRAEEVLRGGGGEGGGDCCDCVSRPAGDDAAEAAAAARRPRRDGLVLLVAAGGDEYPPNLCRAAGYPGAGRVWDGRRTLRCFLVGVLWRAPNQTWWYAVAQRIHGPGLLYWAVPALGAGPAHSVWVTLVDQLTFTPWLDAGFLFGEAWMKRWGTRDDLAGYICRNDLAQKFPPVLFRNWQVWPAINVIMYLYVPPVWWVPYNGFCNYLWNVYLTWKAAQTIEGECDVDDDEEEEGDRTGAADS